MFLQASKSNSNYDTLMACASRFDYHDVSKQKNAKKRAFFMFGPK
jgi:hypothetical protein